MLIESMEQIDIVCLLITHLPAKLEIRRNKILQHKAFLIITSSKNGAKILDYSPQIKGVISGMPLEKVPSRYKNSLLINADEFYYKKKNDQIANTLLNLTPLVEKENLGIFYLCMKGTEIIYGGHKGILNILIESIPRYLVPRIGLANSKFVSYVAAVYCNPDRPATPIKDVSVFLEKISIDRLPLSWEEKSRLHTFGLHTIGQISSVSIGAMQAQFGKSGSLAWSLANGIDERPIISFKQNDSITKVFTFQFPVVTLLEIIFAIDGLLDQVFSDPFLGGKYIRALYVRVDISNENRWEKVVSLKIPVNRKALVLDALKDIFEATNFPGPLESISITVLDMVDEFSVQSNIFGDVHKRKRIREAIDRLKIRLQIDVPLYKVMDMEPCSRIPERRYSLIEFVP